MRSHFAAIAFAIALALLPNLAFADVDPYPAELAAVRRELAAAKIEARLYWQAEYQRERRELNAAIQVSDAEVQTLRREFRRFGPFNAFAYGQQPAFGYRNARLCLAEAEARRRLLIEERNNLNRLHSDHLALLQLRVADARARVVESEGGELIELDVVQP